MSVHDYVTVPAGEYLCQVAEVRTGHTRHGDYRCSLRLVVAEGEHIGRQAAWDSLVFSPRGESRTNAVLAAIGITDWSLSTLNPTDITGRKARVTIRAAEYQSEGGEVVRRNEVPFDGWRSA